jgi:hypothetical protein
MIEDVLTEDDASSVFVSDVYLSAACTELHTQRTGRPVQASPALTLFPLGDAAQSLSLTALSEMAHPFHFFKTLSAISHAGTHVALRLQSYCKTAVTALLNQVTHFSGRRAESLRGGDAAQTQRGRAAVSG